MENKNFWGLLINPFTRIAGWQAFGLGLVFVILSGLFGAWGNLAFDGLLDAHFAPSLSYTQSFTFLAVDIASIVLIVWLCSLIFAGGSRFVDILGTMTLARAPFLILAAAGLFMPEIDHSAIMADLTAVRGLLRTPAFIIFSIIVIPTIVWQITLMYNAIKVSCNIKGTKLTVILIASIILGEVVSKIAIVQLARLIA